MRPDVEYAEKVLSGDIVTGNLTQLACRRHLEDLEAGHKRGLLFDEERADYALGFFPFLRHFEGEFGPSPEHPDGQPFELELWQAFFVACLFGWVWAATGLRRFREAWLWVARKNGKTHLEAAIALLATFFDRDPQGLPENAAQGFMAATKQAQAGICHRIASEFVRTSPELRRELESRRFNLSSPLTRSFLVPIGSDSDRQDGLNVHVAALDEVHAHRSRDLYDVLDSATAARRQPLILGFSTAGVYRPNGIGVAKWEHCVKVLEGAVEDDRFLALPFTVDQGDDWEDPACWPKANPNLHVSVSFDDLMAKRDKAKADPRAQNEFRRKHTNQWTEQLDRWIEMDRWRACGGDMPKNATSREFFGGIDLARKGDISTLQLFGPDPEDPFNGLHTCFGWYWCPGYDIEQRAKTDRVPYDQWSRDGWMEATPGRTTDYGFIRRRLNELRSEGWRIARIAFDPHYADQLVDQLEDDGFEMVEVSPSYGHITGGTEELGRLITAAQMRHGDDPVLSWMASNVVLVQNRDGYVRPDKANSTEKIDGIYALVLAVTLWMRNREKPKKPSKYEQDDLVTIG